MRVHPPGSRAGGGRFGMMKRLRTCAGNTSGPSRRLPVTPPKRASYLGRNTVTPKHRHIRPCIAMREWGQAGKAPRRYPLGLGVTGVTAQVEPTKQVLHKVLLKCYEVLRESFDFVWAIRPELSMLTGPQVDAYTAGPWVGRSHLHTPTPLLAARDDSCIRP